eukprot:Transcript_3408.p2 GENE.Transcript_3408~~Transcript_3408.p2  ORF type:complete len:749 (-),score=293.83 Transcript_3408:158-2404(-)
MPSCPVRRPRPIIAPGGSSGSGSLPRPPERRLRTSEACAGLRSPPAAAPKEPRRCFFSAPRRADQAVARKEELMTQLEEIKMPGNALDLLVAHFGVSQLAEMTGRKMRFVTASDGTTRREPRAENGVSADQVNIEEKKAFLSGRKPVAVISDAASSGISLHADPRFGNTKKRLHITLELAWSADKMLQQFGRTHRSNQLQAPHYMILTTDVGGEQRFASSVARRLETLGAITRGDRRGGHGMAADLVQFNLDTPLGHAALALMLDGVAEKTERAMLWDRALRMLQCHRQGVPTLLGLCVVAVAQSPATAAQKAREAQRLPAGLQKYVLKLREWTGERLAGQHRQRPPERATYGDCPKVPMLTIAKALEGRREEAPFGWQGACEGLQRMRMLNAKLTPADQDKYNINKFLNRLLGLPFAQQNALFDYYTQVFKWVVMTARQQGRVDSGIELVDGESIATVSEPEVIHKEPSSLALTFHYTLSVDTGLSFASARDLLEQALLHKHCKSNRQGGGSGFWQQARSSRVVLALEVMNGIERKEERMYRILRPTLHSSAKPQYTRFKQLQARYNPLRQEAQAEQLWLDEYQTSEKARTREVHLLGGAVLPVWAPLREVLRQGSRQEQALQVRRCNVDGSPIIGVALSGENVRKLTQRLERMEGGKLETIKSATLKVRETRRHEEEEEEEESSEDDEEAGQLNFVDDEPPPAAPRAHPGAARGGGGAPPPARPPSAPRPAVEDLEDDDDFLNMLA